jgi:hypothetical protein
MLMVEIESIPSVVWNRAICYISRAGVSLDSEEVIKGVAIEHCVGTVEGCITT